LRKRAVETSYPTVAAAISACENGGQLQRALGLLDEMASRDNRFIKLNVVTIQDSRQINALRTWYIYWTCNILNKIIDLASVEQKLDEDLRKLTMSSLFFL
jgi:hypothetical protein